VRGLERKWEIAKAVCEGDTSFLKDFFVRMHITHISTYSAYVCKCFVQCVAVCCNVLQCVAVCCSMFLAHMCIVTRCTCTSHCNAAQFTETKVIYGFQMRYFS